jgi:hypothetical protein
MALHGALHGDCMALHGDCMGTAWGLHGDCMALHGISCNDAAPHAHGQSKLGSAHKLHVPLVSETDPKSTNLVVEGEIGTQRPYDIRLDLAMLQIVNVLLAGELIRVSIDNDGVIGEVAGMLQIAVHEQPL